MKSLFIASCLFLSSCTLTNVCTHGKAEDIVDSSPSTEASLEASVPVSPTV